MAFKTSRLITLDASVARAAGGEEAVHPTSTHCRDCLRTLLRLSHQIVMTGPIQEEWNKHKSEFARTWLVSMYARRRVVRVMPTSRGDLRDILADCASSEKTHGAMLKDFHLIEAALMTDRTIIALDEIVRSLFCGASAAIGELRTIIWANPDKADDVVVDWLEEGAEPEAHRLLTPTDPP